MQIAMLNSWIMSLRIQNCDTQDLCSEYLFNISFVNVIIFLAYINLMISM